MKIGVVADVQYSSVEPDDERHKFSRSLKLLEQTLARFVAAGIEHVVQLGDAAQAGGEASGKTPEELEAALLADLAAVRDAFDAFPKLTVHHVLGNHDCDRGREAFAAAFRVDPPYHYAPKGLPDAVVVDSCEVALPPVGASAELGELAKQMHADGLGEHYSGCPSDGQMAWLEEHARPILFTHIPAVCESAKHSQFNASKFADWCDASGVVRLVVAGHYHVGCDITTPGGVRHFTVKGILDAPEGAKVCGAVIDTETLSVEELPQEE